VDKYLKALLRLNGIQARPRTHLPSPIPEYF
jgi:hypothetical protein